LRPNELLGLNSPFSAIGSSIINITTVSSASNKHTNMSGAAATSETADEQQGSAQMLVSEFPPPPFYYKSFASLTPPEIPTDLLRRGTQRAAASAKKSREESEMLRLQKDIPNTDAILGGVHEGKEDNGEVVAVFGEIVEDPYLVEVQDICEDPTKIRDEVNRLNREVVQGFVGLVKDLVHRPVENKKRRDELSHNTFLMLQECNKFREHQAREMLIELLEEQLDQRREVLAGLQAEILKANEVLESKNDL